MNFKNAHWDDYRAAYEVAQVGSLTRAARALNCNHATVQRHINRLEQNLNIKLFIRHQRGYKLTDAGQIMLSEMPDIEKAFGRMENLMGSVEQDISGNLRITTLVSYSSVLSSVLAKLHHAYPGLRIQLITTDEIVPLEKGIAHVSLRIGQKPSGSDLIVKKLKQIDMAYYAADSYAKNRGLPGSVDELNQHDWVIPSADKHHIPYFREILQFIEIERVIFQSNHIPDIHSAVLDGMGIGLVPVHLAEQSVDMHRLEIKNLAHADMGALWFVYHRDLKNNAKVKTLYSYLLDSLEQS